MNSGSSERTGAGPGRRGPAPSLVVRDAGPDDVVVLQAIFRRSSLANQGDRAALLQHPDALVLESPGERDRVRLAVIDGDVAGFATARDLGAALELIDLFVDPPFMRLGAGHALVQDARAQALEAGRPHLVVTANPHALDFYEAEGFVAVGEVETRFGPGSRMRLSVSR